MKIIIDLDNAKDVEMARRILSELLPAVGEKDPWGDLLAITKSKLHRNGVKNLEQLLSCSKAQLLGFSYFGRKHLNDIISVLEKHGLRLAA